MKQETSDFGEVTVLFENEDLLVLNKPAGITVNKSDTTIHEKTVQEWIETNYQFSVINSQVVEEHDFYSRAGIVHRLDKETSGILLVAKNIPAFEELQRQFKQRIVKKWYIALAHGSIRPAEGEIRVPVGRLPWNRTQFGIVADGKEAVTKYKVISNVTDRSSHETLSLVELYPETGRTHQIRVHLKYLGHPIVSDYLYAGRKVAQSDRKLLNRVFLHAAKISFDHPVTKEKMTFEAPLAKELKLFLETQTKKLL